MTKKLMRDFTSTNQSTLEDLLMIMAKNVEDSLIQAGATPGVDYSYLDLYKMAQPFALEVYKKQGDITHATSWPDVKE